METALMLVNMFNLVAPGIASLVVLIRRKDGTISVAALLDEADAQFEANIKQAADWLKAHGH